jgi:hypothetical protein
MHGPKPRQSYGLTNRSRCGHLVPVNKKEARRIALTRIEELRRMSWDDLRERYLRKSEMVEVTAPSGVVYQVETEVFWDSRRRGDLRVIVAVDVGGWRALFRLPRLSSVPRTGLSSMKTTSSEAGNSPLSRYTANPSRAGGGIGRRARLRA